MKLSPWVMALMVFLGVVCAAFLLAAWPEPYLHYECNFPTGIQTDSTVTFTVGVETPPILSYVTFDVSLSGQYKAESAYRIELTGGTLSTTFSYNENWLKLGVDYTLDNTFSTFVEFKLVFPLFRNMGVQSGTVYAP